MAEIVILNDDYAVIESRGIRFYYGYEVQAGEEWAFEFKSPDAHIVLTQEEIGARDQWDCGENLMYGIRALIAQGRIKFEVCAAVECEEGKSDGE